MDDDEIILELAWLERRAIESVRRRLASQHLGEAWIGLANSDTARCTDSLKAFQLLD